MALLLKPSSRVEEWAAALGAELCDEEVRVWPNVGDPSEIEILVAWRMEPEEIALLTRLEFIMSLGAGTEQWQRPGIEVPVVRLVDPAMSNEMAAYALAWVIRHHRAFVDAQRFQREGRWAVPEHKRPHEFHVGVLGYGEIGSRIAQAFAALGYPVNAWTRSGRDEAGVAHFAGPGELARFLGASDAVVNVLPSTPATSGLLDRARFGQFADGAVFVNIGRGTILASEADLIDALNAGPLAAAVLDVTNPEPPVEGSPLYSHPQITLTAHLSGMTQVASAAQVIAENVRRIRAGERPFPLLDRSRGY